MTLDEQEKQELDQAMAMSQSMNGDPMLLGQENGVIDAQKPQFGPATREHYDTAKWTLTLPGAGAHAREIIENPDPPDRQRKPHSPALLKPSLEDTRLPALITILHAIPLAREALLNLDHTIPDYGIDAEWWDGVGIDVRTLQVAYPEQERIQASSGRLLYEVQRLMAFLDHTDRAYGSTDALMRLVKDTEEYKMNPSLGKIVEALATAALLTDSGDSLADPFVSEARRTYMDQTEPEIHLFWCLDVPIPDNSLRCHTLYDVIDSALWASLQEDSSEYAFFHKLGDVLCVQLTPQNQEQSTGLGIKVPAVLYLDRYLETSRQQALEMLAAERCFRKEVERIDRAKARITSYQSSTDDQKYNALALITQATQHFANADPVDDATKVAISDNEQDRNHRMLDQLQRLAGNVEQKLNGTDEHELSLLTRLISLWSSFGNLSH